MMEEHVVSPGSTQKGGRGRQTLALLILVQPRAAGVLLGLWECAVIPAVCPFCAAGLIKLLKWHLLKTL